VIVLCESLLVTFALAASAPRRPTGRRDPAQSPAAFQ